MRVVLAVVLLFTLVVAGDISANSTTVFHQIYATMFYVMALMSFCVIAILNDEKKLKKSDDVVLNEAETEFERQDIVVVNDEKVKKNKQTKKNA